MKLNGAVTVSYTHLCMGEDFVYMVQDGLIERDSLTTFGEIIRGKKPGRESDDERILCLLYTSRCV